MSKNKNKPFKQELQTKLNKRISQINITKQEKMKNLVNNTNQAMYQSLQSGQVKMNDSQNIAKKLIKQNNRSIFDEIINGQFFISQKQISYNLSKRNLQKYLKIQDQMQRYHNIPNNQNSVNQSQIKMINKQLKQLHDNIRKQKQLEKNQMKKLEQKAKQFIDKVHKEKYEFKEKLKSKRSQSRIFIRAYSQETIRAMKDKLAQKKQQKKKNLQQKLKNIEKRNVQRLQTSVNNQINYWEKVKNYQSCKHLKNQETSEKLFPKIKNTISSSSLKSRYESHKSNRVDKAESNYKSSSVLNNKFQQIDQYMLKAKLMLQKYQHKSKQQESKSRIKIKQRQQKSEFDDLYISNGSYNGLISLNPQFQNHKLESIDKFKLKINENQIKNLQDQSIKNPLKYKMKNKGKMEGELSTLLVSANRSDLENQNLLIYANNLRPGKNPIQSSLETSWKITLNKIKFNQINKVKGLALLSQYQKRLDKYDLEGIVQRLKIKADVINSLQKDASLLDLNDDIKNEVKNLQTSKLINIADVLPSLQVSKSKIHQNMNKKILESSQNQFITNQFKSQTLKI